MAQANYDDEIDHGFCCFSLPRRAAPERLQQAQGGPRVLLLATQRLLQPPTQAQRVGHCSQILLAEAGIYQALLAAAENAACLHRAALPYGAHHLVREGQVVRQREAQRHGRPKLLLQCPDPGLPGAFCAFCAFCCVRLSGRPRRSRILILAVRLPSAGHAKAVIAVPAVVEATRLHLSAAAVALVLVSLCAKEVRHEVTLWALWRLIGLRLLCLRRLLWLLTRCTRRLIWGSFLGLAEGIDALHTLRLGDF
mmetsp:Transcript_59819/g.142819  ORF Transcript_59819/g.142819 Transcript_59819/m.142819 type:complete len:252 (+) Transcript_59819:861-1616(+)